MSSVRRSAAASGAGPGRASRVRTSPRTSPGSARAILRFPSKQSKRRSTRSLKRGCRAKRLAMRPLETLPALEKALLRAPATEVRAAIDAIDDGAAGSIAHAAKRFAIGALALREGDLAAAVSALEGSVSGFRAA